MKAYHTLVTGDSGGGKSTLLAEMAAEFDGLTIIIDPVVEPEDSPDQKFSGNNLRGARTVRSAAEARRSDAHIIHWVTDAPDSAAGEARQMAKAYRNATGYPAQIIVDEAQETGLADGEGPVKSGLHGDRDDAIKWVVATQDPSDLAYPPLKQCRTWVWVGEPAMWHEGFLRWWGMSKEQLPDREYEYVVFDKSGREQYRGETKEEYA
jgi:hypothetical protein